MNHQGEIEKKKYRNWVRGGLAYKYLKEGLEGFADDVVQLDHARILNVVSHTPGLTCNQCCLGNLRPSHTCKKDHAGRKKCPWGQANCNCIYPKKQPCPFKICDTIMEDILKGHGSLPPTPNWKNTDIQKWCSDPWEIAKCYINAPGYSDKTHAADMDTPGLLHIFINNINLQSRFSKSLNGSDIFKKILQRRNELFHSPTMEMEDSKLNECIDDIIDILEDEKELKARHDAQQAVLKLKQLKQESFIVTTYKEVEVCRDALASITNRSEELKQTIRNAKDDISKKQTEATEATEGNVKECRDAVATVTNTSAELKQTIQEAKADIGKEKAEAIETLKDKTQKALQQIDKHNETLYDRVGRLEIDSSFSIQRLSVLEGKVNQLDTIRQNRQRQLEYVQGKQVLQTKLVELYQKHYVNSSISPLKLQENDINIKDVYVAPEMVVEVKQDRFTTNSEENTTNELKTRTVTRYREILQTNGKKHKQIYIVGDVGTGKSAFCKMMIQNWCSAVTCREAEVSVDPVSDMNSVNFSNKAENYDSNNAESSVSDKDEDCVTDKDESSIYNRDKSSTNDNNDSSASDKVKSSAIEKYKSSVSGKDESSASDKDKSSACDMDEKSFSAKVERSVSGEGESRVDVRADSSVCNNDESSANDKDKRSVINKNVSSACNSYANKDDSSVSCTAKISDRIDEDTYMHESSDLDDVWADIESLIHNDYGQNQLPYVNSGDISMLRTYDFLFFVPLQRMSGLGDITEMIKAILTTADITPDDFMDKIFEQESERCLIVADGLDEWTPPKRASILQHVSYGLPNRDRVKHATLVTLSRPSAKGILNMRSSECDQKVDLLGINVKSMVHFIKRYMSKLNKTGLSYREFIDKIGSAQLDHLEKSPLLLQQLVWLYGTGNKVGKSISDAYSHLVNIMLGWFQNKEDGDNSEEDQICNTKQDSDMNLPSLLRRFPKCEENKRFLLLLARLAFEALTSETGTSTFGRLHLRQKGVPKKAIHALIKFGILIENNCFDPTLENTQIEFIHISYLEFLAAVHVSSHCHIQTRSVLPNTVLQDLFKKCKSATDLLQFTNVLKMVCGLSPFLISEISKFVSDIVNMDETMISYRNSLQEYWYRHDHISDQIQYLILGLLSECDSNDQPVVSLCDVVIYRDIDLSLLQRIKRDNVLSLRARCISDVGVWRWIARLTRLQYIHIGYSELPHKEVVLLPTFILAVTLKNMSLFSVECKYSYCQGHKIDLSKHAELQMLELRYCKRLIITHINTKHLEKVRLGYSNILNKENLLDASSLTELEISYAIGYYSGYNSRMNYVIHTLHKLRKLKLNRVDVADSALTVTPEMRNLEHIELEKVSMSLQTWRTFVDSLLTLQQSVQVNTDSLISVGIDQDYHAFDYVRRNTVMYKMIEGDKDNFRFMTKK